MKNPYIPSARRALRLAPRIMGVSATAFALSLIWVTPAFEFIVLPAAAGLLVSFLHTKMWQTGSEGYQWAAMGASLLSYCSVMSPHSGIGLKFQYISILFLVYAVTLMALRRGLSNWIRISTETDLPGE